MVRKWTGILLVLALLAPAAGLASAKVGQTIEIRLDDPYTAAANYFIHKTEIWMPAHIAAHLLGAEIAIKRVDLTQPDAHHILSVQISGELEPVPDGSRAHLSLTTADDPWFVGVVSTEQTLLWYYQKTNRQALLTHDSRALIPLEGFNETIAFLAFPPYEWPGGGEAPHAVPYQVFVDYLLSQPASRD